MYIINADETWFLHPSRDVKKLAKIYSFKSLRIYSMSGKSISKFNRAANKFEDYHKDIFDDIFDDIFKGHISWSYPQERWVTTESFFVATLAGRLQKMYKYGYEQGYYQMLEIFQEDGIGDNELERLIQDIFKNLKEWLKDE